MSRNRALAVLLLLALVALGCGARAGGGLEIEAWARASAQPGGVSAAYLTISNGGPASDTLLRATSTAAAAVELHRTSSSGGMTGMHPVSGLEVPAGDVVTMAPGGTHVMLIGLTRELRAGDTLQLDLEFEHAGSVTVTADIRAS